MIKFVLLCFLPFFHLLADWPQYHGPFFDKSTKNPLPINPGSITEDNIIWKCPTPLGFSSFSTSSDRAFTLVAEEDEDGLLREICIALDLSTGQRIWHKQLSLASYGHGGGNAGTLENSGGDGPRSTPSVHQGLVFIYDSAMALHCLSSDTGKQIWKIDVIKEHEGRNITWKNASSPLLINDLVIICGGGSGQSLIGVEQKTGKVRWENGDETLTHATPAYASIHGQEQVLFLCRSGLISIDPQTGKKLWTQEFPFKVSTASSPVVANDLVFCSAGYGVGAAVFRISQKGGSWESKMLWRKRNELMNHWSTPLYYRGHIYGIFGFKEYGKAPLQCIDLATGTIQWSKKGFGQGNLIRSGDTLLALSDDGQLVTVSATPRAYHELGRMKFLDGKCWSTPTLNKNYLLSRSTKEGGCILLKK